MGAGDDTRQRVLRGAYECIGRHGMAKTTVDDVAATSGVSRATIYRIFPGGKDEVLRDTVGWEMDRFFLRLGEELGDAADFPEFLERALPLARRELLEHTVLQKVLETEPDRLNALITVQQHRVIGAIAAYFLPLLERDRSAGLVTADVDLAAVAEYVARLSLSLIASPGRHDLTDPAEVHRLVRGELLGGVLVTR
jgi:AcrR family transcriptional regulator